MRYFKDDKVYDECEIKKLAYPSTLPKNFKPEHIASKGFLPVIETEKPVITDLEIIHNDGVKLVNGIATQTWTVKDKFETQEEVEAYLADIAKKEADAIIQAKAAEIERLSREAKMQLKELDLKSIRAIREYILTKDDAPKYLKDYEAEAAIERKKVASVK